MGFPKSVRSIEIEQQCKYGFTEDFVETLISKECVKQYAWIKHDMENENHIHCMLWFRSPVPTDSILKWIEGKGGISQLEKIKKDDSACAYLTHANRPEKYQYQIENVHTNIEDFKGITEREKALSNVQPLIDDILCGKLTENELKNGTYGNIYVKHKRKIDTAFEYYYDSKRRKVMKEEKDIVVVFIDGDSRTGKTSYVIDQCKALHLSYCKSSSSNDILQDYVDEEVLVLDDLRDNALRMSDFLKFTDPHVRSTTQSRYRNKCFVGSMIFITTTKPLEKWYIDCTDEQRVQFTSRIAQHWHFTKDDITMYVHKDDVDTNDFVEVRTIPNIMKDKYRTAYNESLALLDKFSEPLRTAEPLKSNFNFVDDNPFT